MRSLFAYSLLFVQLVLVAAQEYAIGSARTKSWIANYDVRPGARVRTVQGQDDQVPPDALYLRVRPDVTISPIFDPNTGLFVGAENLDGAGGEMTLRWVPREYLWQIEQRNGSPYVISPLGGRYYWLDNFLNPNVIELALGDDITDGDVYWRFQPDYD